MVRASAFDPEADLLLNRGRTCFQEAAALHDPPIEFVRDGVHLEAVASQRLVRLPDERQERVFSADVLPDGVLA